MPDLQNGAEGKLTYAGGTRKITHAKDKPKKADAAPPQKR
jgi:hypothetical protein